MSPGVVEAFLQDSEDGEFCAGGDREGLTTFFKLDGDSRLIHGFEQVMDGHEARQISNFLRPITRHVDDPSNVAEHRPSRVRDSFCGARRHLRVGHCCEFGSLGLRYQACQGCCCSIMNLADHPHAICLLGKLHFQLGLLDIVVKHVVG